MFEKFSNITGKGETILGQLVQALGRGLDPGEFGNGTVLLGGPTLEKCANHLPVLDPVRTKLGFGGCWAVVSEKHGFAHVVTIELP